MPLSAGAKLGPYEIVAKLGEGGMGEVYRARDTRLDRDVAIKILPESFATDADRVARFTREAKTLAALNHPNIAAIFGIEEQGATRALVMELVDGEDLSQVVARGPVAFGDALQIARQTADALEAAHGQGIIHRDLKPANIKIRPDGTVKVLDFGLAKAVDPTDPSGSAVANSPTLTNRATQLGMILGTAAYMAPEQAKGRAVDKRADIWAFGAVLYEMLTGERAFKGDDVTEVLASVIKDTPDLGALPAGVPIRLKELIGRCLERDLKKRQRDIGDVLLELSAIEGHRDSPSAAPPVSRPSLLATAAIAVGALIIGGGAGWLLRTAPAPNTETTPIRIAVTASDGVTTQWPQITPDGRVVVFSTKGRLYRRAVDSFDAVPIPGTDGAAVPIISPDGRDIAFFTRGELRRVPLAGGDPVKVADTARETPGGSWGTNGEIVYSRAWAGGLWAVPASGGSQPRRITEPDRAQGERGHWRPQFLPDGKRVLFTIMMAGTGVNDSRIAILDFATGKYRALFPGTDALYLRSGHILFFHGGTWRLVPFDLTAERTTGEAVTVLADAFGVPPDGGAAGTLISVSESGAVAYLPGPMAPERELVWISRSGVVEPLGLPSHAITSATLSPDGRRVAMTRVEGGTYQVWVADVARKIEDRLDVKGSNFEPRWDPRSEWLSFISERKGQYDVYIAKADGSGERALLVEDYDEAPAAWLHGSRRILAKQWKSDGTMSMVAVDAETGASQQPVFPAEPPTLVDVSPNDRWLLYATPRSGRAEVFVRAFAADAAAVRVSTAGGYRPYWSANGQEVIFLSQVAGQLTVMTASFKGDGAQPEPGVPRALITLPPSSDLYGVSNDGQRFLVGRLVGPERPPGVRVVLNWFDEVRAGAKGK